MLKKIPDKATRKVVGGLSAGAVAVPKAKPVKAAVKASTKP